jgi:hypothetical protein
MRLVRIITILTVMTFGSGRVFAGTALDFWHSYTHAQTHETHYAFHLSSFKRGLFWGSCGPSTRSVQWSYNFDLTGEGPVYKQNQLSASDDDGKKIGVVSGLIKTDLKSNTVTIDVEVEQAGTTNKFVGNGVYSIRRIK